MTVELAEVAAGLPAAAFFALAGGVSTLREGRRRSVLNEAVHEIRRPLQALALAAPAGDEVLERSLRIATAAVRRLECEINGEDEPEPAEAIAVRPLLETCAARWRPRADREGRALTVHSRGRPECARGSTYSLSQLLDNLIINGLEHGSGDVSVGCQFDGHRVLILVRDEGAPGKPRRRLQLGGRRWRRRGRQRHGHGLRVVRRSVARLGGSFRLQRDRSGTTAVVELPVAGGEK